MQQLNYWPKKSLITDHNFKATRAIKQLSTEKKNCSLPIELVEPNWINCKFIVKFVTDRLHARENSTDTPSCPPRMTNPPEWTVAPQLTVQPRGISATTDHFSIRLSSS